VAEPARLLAAIDRSTSSMPSEIIRVYKQTTHRLIDVSLEEKASYLELSAIKQREYALAEQIASLPLARRWVPRWASWTFAQTHRVFEGHTGVVQCVALGGLAVGRWSFPGAVTRRCESGRA
jgi:hypothetical protein